MTLEIHSTVGGREQIQKRTTGALMEGGRLSKAGLVAAVILLLTAAAAPAADKTQPRDALPLDKEDRVADLALSPDGKTVVLLEFHSSSPQSGIVWDVQAKKQLRILKSDGWEGGSPIAFTADGGSLLVLGSRRVERDDYRPSVGVWDVKTWTLSRTVDLELGADRAAAVFTPDGKSLVVGTRALRPGLYGLQVYDLQSGKRTLDLKCDEGPGAVAPPPPLPPGIAPVIPAPPRVAPAPALAVSPDGKTLAVATQERFLFLFDLGTGKTLQKAFGMTFSLLTFSPDGKTLVCGNRGGSGEIQVWDVATGKNTDTLRVNSIIRAYSLSFSPDGKTLAMGGERGMVELWDIAQFGFRDDFSGRGRADQSDSVEYLAFSADGKTLVSAGHDATVSIWDVPVGAPKDVRRDTTPPFVGPGPGVVPLVPSRP